MSSSEIPVLPAFDLQGRPPPVLLFDVRQNISRSSSFPKLVQRSIVICGHQYQEFVPAENSHTKEVYDLKTYLSTMTLMAPVLADYALKHPVSFYQVQAGPRMPENAHIRDHYRCGQQGIPVMRGTHICDHEKFCNEVPCALFDIMEDQVILKDYPKNHLVDQQFHWRNIFYGLWFVDLDHVVKLEYWPTVILIIIKFIDDPETAKLTEHEKMLIKALNYDIIFVELEDEVNFALLMVVQRILTRLTEAAIPHFIKQVVQLYGPDYGDLSKMFHKLVAQAKWDIEAMTDSVEDHQTPAHEITELEFGKVTSIVISNSGNKFDYKAEGVWIIQVHTEIKFGLESACPKLIRHSLKWFDKVNSQLYSGISVSEPYVIQIEAERPNIARHGWRKSCLLKGTFSRNLLRLKNSVAVTIQMIVLLVTNRTIVVSKSTSFVEYDCPDLCVIPYEFWLNINNELVVEKMEDHLSYIGSNFGAASKEAEAIKTFF
ncbi:hypothetical protein HDE_04456 [Halotydeus destructor]|nr:hypothetical protein HDE_04456 [Halotydeus destructor]